MPVAIKNNPNISIVNQFTEMTDSRERDRSRSKKVIKIKKKNHRIGLDEEGKAKLETTFEIESFQETFNQRSSSLERSRN